MSVSKVILNGNTLVDLTGDTAEPSDVLSNETFHDRSGASQTGSMITHDVYDGLDSTSTDDALSANQGKVLNEKFSSSVINPIAFYAETFGSSADIDTLERGCAYTSSSTRNIPKAANCLVLAFSTNTGVVAQIAFVTSTSEFYHRTRFSGTWNAWIKNT